MMGTGEAEGDDRAVQAAEAAISNPLLDNTSMKGARGVLINITGGSDMTLFQVDQAANRIREEVDTDANIIFGSAFNPELDGKIRVSIVATGIDQQQCAKKPTVSETINNIAAKPEQKAESNNAAFSNFEQATANNVANDEDEESDSFIPNAPVEMNEFEDEQQAFEAPQDESMEDEQLKTASKNDEYANANEAPKKAKEDFFDIPAFLRKKIKF